jgi:hypothetical protein
MLQKSNCIINIQKKWKEKVHNWSFQENRGVLRHTHSHTSTMLKCTMGDQVNTSDMVYMYTRCEPWSKQILGTRFFTVVVSYNDQYGNGFELETCKFMVSLTQTQQNTELFINMNRYKYFLDVNKMPKGKDSSNNKHTRTQDTQRNGWF